MAPTAVVNGVVTPLTVAPVTVQAAVAGLPVRPEPLSRELMLTEKLPGVTAVPTAPRR